MDREAARIRPQTIAIRSMGRMTLALATMQASIRIVPAMMMLRSMTAAILGMMDRAAEMTAALPELDFDRS